MTRPHSDDPSRRTVLQTTGAALTASLLPDWLPFVDGEDELTTDERLDSLEDEALRYGPLEDRPDAEDVPDGRKWLDPQGVIAESDGDEWLVDRIISEPETAIGSMYFTSNDVVTTIEETDEWVDIAGESEAGVMRDFTHLSSSNTIRHDGDHEILRRVVITMAISAAENNALYEFALFNNGEVIDTRIPFEADDQEQTYNVTINNLIELDPGEEFRPQVRATEGTSDLTVENMSLTIY